MRHRMDGTISACGFASGDRVVVGLWEATPIGPMADVMWAEPDGTRTLFAPTGAVAAFVTAVYDFDAVVVGPLVAEGDATTARVRIGDVHGAGERTVVMATAAGWRIPPARRPPALTRWVEAPLARALLGVRTHGTSPHGVHEWYQATAWRPVVAARGTVDGHDLGALSPIDPPCRFGFSEPPPRPSITAVRPLLEDPSGALDRLVVDLRAGVPVEVLSPDPPPHP